MSEKIVKIEIDAEKCSEAGLRAFCWSLRHCGLTPEQAVLIGNSPRAKRILSKRWQSAAERLTESAIPLLAESEEEVGEVAVKVAETLFESEGVAAAIQLFQEEVN
jgi:hypothetical protein